MRYKVHKDTDGWYVNQGQRRYLTQEDAETVAGALQARFIDAETDEEVNAVLAIIARIESQGTTKS